MSVPDLKNLTEVKEIYQNLEDFADKKVKIGGFVKTTRAQKSLCFINLSDGSCFDGVQLVLEPSKLDNYDEAASAHTGECVICEGKVVLTPEMKQPFEIQCDKFYVEGESPESYPLQPKRHSPEFLRSIPHLRPRANLFQAVFRLRSEISFAIHQYFRDSGFVYVHTPILTETDAEGAGEMFNVTTFDLKDVPKDDKGNVDYKQDFFGKRAHLTVTGQLEGECFAQAFRNIYTFGPTFRAEKSFTPRHAAEFWMIEPEMAFADVYKNMEVAEGMMKAIINHCFKYCPSEMEFFNKFVAKGKADILHKIADSNFECITYTEAIEILEKSGKNFEYKPEWGIDLQTEHERYLCEVIFDKPVFVIDYPKDIKAFYMKQNDDGKTVRGMDLLVPGVGEIIGGSQREEDLEKLTRRINEIGLKEEEYSWYLDLRRYGTVRHAGYGLGFERAVMYISGVQNIRDVIPFPRTAGQML